MPNVLGYKYKVLRAFSLSGAVGLSNCYEEGKTIQGLEIRFPAQDADESFVEYLREKGYIRRLRAVRSKDRIPRYERDDKGSIPLPPTNP